MSTDTYLNNFLEFAEKYKDKDGNINHIVIHNDGNDLMEKMIEKEKGDF